MLIRTLGGGKIIKNTARSMMGGVGASQSYEEAIKRTHYAPTMWETHGRTSLQFTLTEAPGILNKAINIFTNNQVNMTRIHSKPSKFFSGGWRSVDFFIDVEGHTTDINLQNAIS